MKHILITGGAGFIGSNVVKYALNLGLTVTVMDSFEHAAVSKVSMEEMGAQVLEIDIQDSQSVEQLNVKFDAIIHLAAQVSVPKSIQEPEKTHSININGTEHVLELAYRNNINRFIFASSSAVYGDCETLPLKEGHVGELQSPYAQSKAEIENTIDAHFNQGAEFLSLRFFNVYGPNQRIDSNYGAVIPLFVDAFSRQNQPTIYGTGEQSRDFVHVHDVARLLIELAIKPWRNPKQSAYNVGTGSPATVLELASLIHELTDSTSPFKPIFQPARAGDIEHSVASMEATENDLHWKPKISLRDGLKQLIEVDFS